MESPILGMVGLGRMGANMSRRLARRGVRMVAFDPDPKARAALGEEPGCRAVDSLEALAAALPAPRIVWLMVPAGAVTDGSISALKPLLARGDLVVDGGNAFYKDSIRRAAELAPAGIEFVDCGVSGGVWGLENGYSLMFGGSAEAAARLQPLVERLAPSADHGHLHCGPVGSGHFVKMIHNGIEYGMMAAMAEGIALLKGKEEFGLDLAAVTEVWRHGSVVRSWLLDLTADFLKDDARLDAVAPVVADSGEGRWTVNEAVEQGTSAPVLALALMTRFASQGRDDYAARVQAMMRNAFGGHKVTHR